MTKIIAEDDLPAPDDVIKYKNGQTGLVMFHFMAEGCNYQSIANHHGFDVKFRNMEDCDSPAAEALLIEYEAGVSSFDIASRWKPSVPEGWVLAEIYDSEEGMLALFIKPMQDIDGKTGTADDQGLFALDDRSGSINNIEAPDDAG